MPTDTLAGLAGAGERRGGGRPRISRVARKARTGQTRNHKPWMARGVGR
jgi:hypothetical protein